MSKIYGITIDEFQLLLREAQKSHLAQNEPIPELLPANVEKVNSCLLAPFQTFFSVQLYKGFIAKAAILFYLLIKNHPLQNGNKRMAVLSLAYFYKKNRRKLDLTDDAFYQLAVNTAKSTDKRKAILYIKNVLS